MGDGPTYCPDAQSVFYPPAGPHDGKPKNRIPTHRIVSSDCLRNPVGFPHMDLPDPSRSRNFLSRVRPQQGHGPVDSRRLASIGYNACLCACFSIGFCFSGCLGCHAQGISSTICENHRQMGETPGNRSLYVGGSLDILDPTAFDWLGCPVMRRKGCFRMNTG